MPGVAAEGRELAYRCISELIRVLILQVRSKRIARGAQAKASASSLFRFFAFVIIVIMVRIHIASYEHHRH